MYAVIGLLLTTIVQVICFDPSFYTNTQNVFPNKYDIYWNINGSTLFLALAVKDHGGWFAFGLAEQTSGSMGGADIVAAEWDSLNNIYVTDRYGMGTFEPLVDSCSDWHLRSSSLTDSVLYVELQREIDTHDSQDRPIVEGSMKCIAAYGNSLTLGYHGPSNRIDFGVNFMQTNHTAPISGNISTFRVLMNATIPPKLTTYMCQSIKLPSDIRYQAVKFEPVINPISAKYVHHFQMFVCEYQNTTDNVVNKYLGPVSLECFGISPTGGCYGLMFSWAVGSDGFYLPEEAGFPIGSGPNDAHYVLLETHYNNPDGDSGVVDTSGVQITLTDQLRKYEADIMVMGDVYASYADIPPRLSSYIVQTECPSKCTMNWPHPINVFASMLHMHTYGTHIYTVLTQSNGSVTITNRVEFWDFNMQESTPVNYIINPGDQLHTICNYNTQRSTTPIRFGGSTQDEMCMDFVVYYPKMVNYSQCGGVGRTYQVYPNGSSSVISKTPSTICGARVRPFMLYDSNNITIANPIENLTNLEVFNKITFGVPCSPRDSTPQSSLWFIIASSTAGVVLVVVIIVVILINRKAHDYEPIRL